VDFGYRLAGFVGGLSKDCAGNCVGQPEITFTRETLRASNYPEGIL